MRPCDNRLFTLSCKELYQLSPNGAHKAAGAFVNCGKGRSDCATVAVSGKFVVREGRHALDEEIVREFGSVQKHLWRGK